ncbi:hypothetical protein [Alkaliflexus imshenetskii]|uniref:hypothetical protein n=1 Tax=Alkaliflexus imshenetskii TaxID=286730 RepID=UPI00047BF5A4|nr:hypothetical protein [Alkaliflexus imshenetskii]
MNHIDEMTKPRIYRFSIFHKDILDGCLLNEIIENKFHSEIILNRGSKEKDSLNAWEHKLARANIVETKWVHPIVGNDMGQMIKISIV